MNKIRVSPTNLKDKTVNLVLTEGERTDWDEQKQQADETLRKRFRRGSLEVGSDEYVSYFQQRVFNKREAWRPYLWQRKRLVYEIEGLLCTIDIACKKENKPYHMYVCNSSIAL